MSPRCGRTDSWPNRYTLEHICTLLEKNAASSGNLSSCLMNFDPYLFDKLLTGWNWHCLMQFFHLHCSVWNKIKGKCFWLKPGMSPQPPTSALCHTGCCPAVRPDSTWSAPGSRMHVIKEGNSLGNNFILQGGSPWASQCLLLHQRCCYIVNWKVVLLPWNSPDTIPWVKSCRPSTSTSSSKLCIMFSSCTLPSPVWCAQTSLQPQKGQEQGYIHSGYAQQWKNWSTEQVSYFSSRIHLFPSRTVKTPSFQGEKASWTTGPNDASAELSSWSHSPLQGPSAESHERSKQTPQVKCSEMCQCEKRRVSKCVRDGTAGLQS